jgi:hypothetical protein
MTSSRHNAGNLCKELCRVFVFTAAMAASIPTEAAEVCDNLNACSVPGAEVDDEVTVKARRVIGTGPAMGVVADHRLQAEVTEVGKLPTGIKVYAFRYLWDDTVRVGVLAQDLLDRPETKSAVLTLANGLFAVDYGALGLRQATLKQWNEDGPQALRADYKIRSTPLPIPMPQPPAAPDDAVRLFNKRPPF